jgi:hypothetical protein
VIVSHLPVCLIVIPGWIVCARTCLLMVFPHKKLAPHKKDAAPKAPRPVNRSTKSRWDGNLPEAIAVAGRSRPRAQESGFGSFSGSGGGGLRL